MLHKMLVRILMTIWFLSHISELGIFASITKEYFSLFWKSCSFIGVFLWLPCNFIFFYFRKFFFNYSFKCLLCFSGTPFYHLSVRSPLHVSMPVYMLIIFSEILSVILLHFLIFHHLFLLPCFLQGLCTLCSFWFLILK